MKGGSGVGKSFLVSMIIEHLEEHNPEGEIQPLVLYFFCKTGDDTTQRGNKIMLHLISQLLITVRRNFNKEIPNSVFDGNNLTSGDFGRHLRAAEKAWPEEQRLQEKFRWIQLYDDVEKFLNPNSRTFKSWVERTSPWQSMNPINPLHVAAYYGLIGLIKRNAKEKYSNTWDAGGLSALHLACYGVGEFLGIELLLPDEKNINRRAGIHRESPLNSL